MHRKPQSRSIDNNYGWNYIKTFFISRFFKIGFSSTFARSFFLSLSCFHPHHWIHLCKSDLIKIGTECGKQQKQHQQVHCIYKIVHAGWIIKWKFLSGSLKLYAIFLSHFSLMSKGILICSWIFFASISAL